VCPSASNDGVADRGRIGTFVARNCPTVFAPWVEGQGSPEEAPGIDLAERLAAERQRELGAWGISAADLVSFNAGTGLRVLTPGSSAGEPVHILSSLERRSATWNSDPEASRAAVSAAISLVLRLLGKDPDPAKSREHVLLSVLAERRMQQGHTAELGTLLDEVLNPPIDRVGALDVDDFLPAKERKSLAATLNTLLASPTFASWRQGMSLDVREWLTPKNGKTPAVIVSVAHLDDDERTLVLGVLLEEILAYTRSLPGTKRLRALVVFDECYGLLLPHPASPPTKRPTVALMKQGRAFGIGVIVATQNPMDLDYRTLSNAGFWAVGRLQTDADRERVVDSVANANEPGSSAQERKSSPLGAHRYGLPMTASTRAITKRESMASSTSTAWTLPLRPTKGVICGGPTASEPPRRSSGLLA
jgi:hypothetical protein